MGDVSVTVASRLVTLEGRVGLLSVSVTNSAPRPRRIVLSAYGTLGGSAESAAHAGSAAARSGPGPTRSHAGDGARITALQHGAPAPGEPRTAGNELGVPIGSPSVDPARWTTIERPLREIPAGGTEQFTAELAATDAPPGTYDLRFVAYPADRAPEEYRDQGQVVQVVVPSALVEHQRRRRPWWLLVVGAVLLFGIAGVVFALTRPPSVIVPGVVGQSMAEAEASLRAAGLDVAVQAEVGPEPLDTVIRQEPGEGEEVRSGSGVLIFLRVGVFLPDVTGLPVEEATARLGQLVEVDQVPQESDAPAGTVLSMDPGPGAEVGEGSTVELVVATGRTVLVPDVLGSTVGSARATLAEAGLESRVNEGPACRLLGAGCQVVIQVPGPGTRVAVGSAVSLQTP